MNQKERLFELIRREEVVMWVGAGFSRYAGYPSGNELKNIFYESLTRSEKRQLRKSSPLPELTDHFVKIRNNSRHELLRILEKEFVNRFPMSNEYHLKLASIPHIHCIITTNYDRLFEDAYKEKSQAIYSSKRVPYIDSKKVQIFKVHGDLSDPDSIIITKSDYLNFFSKNIESNDLWTTVKAQLLTKNIAFMGYNIEDPNVEVIFNRIAESLGQHKRECFFIAPSLKPLKRSDLRQKGVEYINEKGESFIDELILNIRANIIQDQKDGIVSSDSFSSFMMGHKLLFDLTANNNKLSVGSIRAADSSVKSHLNFTFKGALDFCNDFNDFVSGKRVGDFEIDVKQIENSDFNIGGIKIPYLENASKLIIKSVPQKTIDVDLKFDNGFEFDNIPTEVYGNYPFFHLHSKLKTAHLETKIEVTNKNGMEVKFDYTPSKICSKINEEINELTLLKNLFSGNSFNIYWDESHKFIRQSVPPQKAFNEYIDFFLAYFKNLKSIENHFNIRFPKFERAKINNESKKIVDELITLINRGIVKFHWNGICEATLFDNSQDVLKDLQAKTENEKFLAVINENEETKVMLHEVSINLGYRCVKLEKPHVLNLEELLHGNVKDMKLGSQSKRIVVSYSPEKSSPAGFILPAGG
ncbi:MAG: SIR2 family protein [Candidatus Delongbacteria bacterium]|nr:SIR2 family protein [Candidatus Delongbacteria bacterium]